MLPNKRVEYESRKYIVMDSTSKFSYDDKENKTNSFGIYPKIDFTFKKFHYNLLIIKLFFFILIILLL